MFTVKGSYEKQKRVFEFSIDVEAKTREEAVEKVYSLIGSNHHVKRRMIKLEASK